jgi:predicted  nucleic acid-binding Zn-ribbon protein
METPMFGGAPASRGGGVEGPGFDDGAFMPGAAFEPGGTPAPDFSPDTALGVTMGAAPKPPLPPETDAKKRKKKGGEAAVGGKGPSPLKAVLAAAICLVIGVVVGPFLSTKVQYIPNPLRADIASKQSEIDKLNADLKRAVDAKPKDGKAISQETINQLVQQQTDLNAKIAELETAQQAKQADLEKTTGQIEQVRTDLEQKNEEFVKTQDAFEDLQNQTAIVQARQMGLAAEVERLTGLVGQLDEANQRSSATTQSLKSSVERLVVQIKEGIPLTPEKYSRDARMAAVQDLKTRVELAKWVTPELLNDYTTIYIKELEISSSTAYFFARIPVTNNLGVRETKWAECLMKGNWAVYYRTLDGKNIGSYENTAEPGVTPTYAFRETLPEEVQKHINLEISASRGPDAEARLKALAEKQNIVDGNTSSFQRVFNSL